MLLQAFAEVVEKQDSVKLVIIGDGEDREKFNLMVNELNIQNKVIFTGALPNTKLPEFYASADMFIGPSVVSKDGDTEGFGLTFLEASFSESLLIGSRVGGIVDIIEDGVTGLLFEPGNYIQLADKILWALDSPNEVKSLKHAAYQSHTEKYSWHIIANKYKTVFNKCIAHTDYVHSNSKHT